MQNEEDSGQYKNHYSHLLPRWSAELHPSKDEERLLEILTAIGKFVPNWPDVISKFDKVSSLRLKRFPFDLFTGFAAEEYLRSCLERIAASRSDLRIDPLAYGAHSREYAIPHPNPYTLQSKGSLKINNSMGKQILEIDQLIQVGKFLSPIEITLGRSAFNTRQYGNKSQNSNIFAEKRFRFTEDILNSFLLKNIENTRMVPAAIITPEQMLIGSEEQSKFVKAGGILVPFYRSSADFRNEAQYVYDEYYKNNI